MRIICWLLLVSFSFVWSACSDRDDKNAFRVHGTVKNVADQKLYLEQFFFDQKPTQVLDTAEVKNGRFEVNASGDEEGLYRLRFEKQEIGYVFINDAADINLTADALSMTLNSAEFNTRANLLLKKFLLDVDRQQTDLDDMAMEADSLVSLKAGDSILNETQVRLHAADKAFQQFIIRSVDTLSDPVVAMMALGYSRRIDPKEMKSIVPNLAKRFPGHRGIEGIIAQYTDMMAKKSGPPPPPPPQSASSLIGTAAPEIIMNDTAGQPFKLSSLRGKFVLVDFWASWCAPCRAENPNVAANFNKYKNKNFTILGVSLDENRSSWIQAIKKDGLAWKQVSDLKGWESAAAATYGFQGIPYNVLLDPSGKIIAVELREQNLGTKLAEVLK